MMLGWQVSRQQAGRPRVFKLSTACPEDAFPPGRALLTGRSVSNRQPRGRYLQDGQMCFGKHLDTKHPFCIAVLCEVFCGLWSGKLGPASAAEAWGGECLPTAYLKAAVERHGMMQTESPPSTNLQDGT